MNTFSLWIEISISGFFYVIALFFFLLTILEVKNLHFITCFKDYLAIVGAGIALISYIFGIIAHRFRSESKKYILGEGLGDSSEELINLKARSVDLWQYGSARLHKEIDFQFSILAMLSSLTVGFPLSGLCVAIWFYANSDIKNGSIAFLVGIFLSILSCWVYKIQCISYESFKIAAFREMKKVKRKMAKYRSNF